MVNGGCIFANGNSAFYWFDRVSILKGLPHFSPGWTAIGQRGGGPTPGSCARGALNPERAAPNRNLALTPHVSLVEGDFIPPQQRAELILKRSFAVMGVPHRCRPGTLSGTVGDVPLPLIQKSPGGPPSELAGPTLAALPKKNLDTNGQKTKIARVW